MSSSSSVPKTMKALLIDNKVGSASVQEIAVPKLEANDVLIKIDYVSQNPTDWKHAYMVGQPKAICGCDFSGTVVALGSDLKTPLKVGERVAGSVHGGMFQDKGSFAEYARAESDLVIRVPDTLDQEAASSFGIPWITSLHAIVHSQKRPWPPVKTHTGEWFLVYGASSSVGLFAIQVAKLYGFKTIAVCSPHNFDLVKSYGADEVVDYKDPEACSAQIKKISGGGVNVCLDTISEGKSFEIAVKGFGEKGGRLNAILPAKDEDKKIRSDVEIVSTLMYTLFGKAFTFIGQDLPASKEDRQFGVDACQVSPQVIKDNGIKPNPLKQFGGINDIPKGFEYQKDGKVSGAKLIYKISA